MQERKLVKTDKIIYGKQIFLRQITLQDCTTQYVKWLNDPCINQFLETRFYKQNIKTIKDFVKTQIESDHSLLFAIINKKENSHIGNIKIGPINPHHNHADISYFIGDKNHWNKGIATEAISLICQYAFEDLNLHRLEAGAYSEAIGSWKALEKKGFRGEGNFKEKSLLKK